jgi:hypothetical protein
MVVRIRLGGAKRRQSVAAGVSPWITGPKITIGPNGPAVVFAQPVSALVARVLTSGASVRIYFLLWRFHDLTVVAIDCWPFGPCRGASLCSARDLPVVAILITVVSDLFTVLQSEVNCHHVFKSPWVVLTSDCEIRAGRLTRCELTPVPGTPN